MKKELFLIIFIVLFIDFYINTFCKADHFLPIDLSDSVSSIEDSYGNIITTNKNPHQHTNCCLVKKVFNKEQDEFEYEYNKLDTCNLNIIPAIQQGNMNLFIDGVNNWNNNMCKKTDKKYIGSCRNINFECKDFVSPLECKKYNMEWSNKTCSSPYRKPITIEDRNSRIKQFI